MSEAARARKFFTIGEAAGAMGSVCRPESRGGDPMPQSFRADSREVERGGVFIAMRGERTDGHEYIEDAVRRGASVVILEEGWFGRNAEGLKDLGAAVIPVEDPERSVALLAERWLGMVSPKVVGITGSVGKTTTRELLHGAIKDHMRAHSAVKSYNT
ncbi:MAG: Mur ligase domain-containing protein, partial [Synergistaceae bacterium]|nr:Mur ligase domain-containing protein [Synergistaceae bacterium]